MARREVLRMGHPILRQRAREIKGEEFHTPWFKTLIKDLKDTMHAEEGVGIAAPQIGESVRVSVIDFEEDSERYPNLGRQELSVFVNPVITVLDSETTGFWEGCLSVPGLRGFVERPKRVGVEYLDLNGIKHQFEAEGFISIVLQHEFDHLDGILYVDRIKDFTKFSYIEEYKQFTIGHDDEEEI